jgi:hypothetical protein
MFYPSGWSNLHGYNKIISMRRFYVKKPPFCLPRKTHTIEQYNSTQQHTTTHSNTLKSSSVATNNKHEFKLIQK